MLLKMLRLHIYIILIGSHAAGYADLNHRIHSIDFVLNKYKALFPTIEKY